MASKYYIQTNRCWNRSRHKFT